ncbi:MAG: tetratricopeptide repeat protein [Cyanobacteria bacterium]|nr:tetratricopeptide repeat protein [Cyanobacteriota bacterium]
MSSRYGRRRRSGFLGKFYLNPSAQYTTTIVSAIVFAGFVFSGFLLFRYTDTDDLIARGKRQMAEGKVAWAAKTFQTLVSTHHDSYEGHLLLGQAYLELGERQKAEQEFRTASALKSEDNTGHEADIAMSKYAIAKKDFYSAEEKLTKASRKSPQDPDIKLALFELYDNWADDILATDKDYPLAISKYERALRYVRHYHQEEKVKEKLIEAITIYADKTGADKNFEESIRMLKKSLRYRYLPDTLIEIAESYEAMENLDESINWYRKAFDADPSVISIKLSNMLIKKGRLLLEEKKPEEAEKYFDEARNVSKSANVPMDVLFPVTAQNVKISAQVDEETGEFLPQVSVSFQNGGQRSLNYLNVKATFYSGDEAIGEAVVLAASPEDPLNGKNLSNSSKSLVLKPTDKLNINQLSSSRKLRVKIAISYTAQEGSTWKDMAIQEIDLKSTAQNDEPAPTGKKA